MLFNSLDFAIFLPIVFLMYWMLDRISLMLQNLLIVVASYIFYGWWDWRFLSLILFSTVVDFVIGSLLSKEENQQKRKRLLQVSIVVNLGLLGFFKYYNFFLDNFQAAFSFLGHPIGHQSLDIILPVGISFYTFQTLSYTIDVYRKKLEPTNDFIAFAAFVCFFPQLVAGPIERATNLLPQFLKKRTFEYNKAIDGFYQILWGLFKKIVIADNAAQIANEIFNNSDNYSGITLIFGAIFFAFQIYGDFSGYSDIAIGTSKLFGINLMQNFAVPYFSRDIAEFWRRWHISLSTWFRDYVYIPLGGSRVSTWLKIRNIFIIFIVSGFWHGANWTFIAWGALNALYFLPLLLLNKNRVNVKTNVADSRYFPSLKEFVQMLVTFGLTVFAWIFFRAENMGHALRYISNIFSANFFNNPKIVRLDFVIIVLIFLIIEWVNRAKLHTLQFSPNPKNNLVGILQIFFVCLIVWATILWGQSDNKEFIYFQF